MDEKAPDDEGTEKEVESLRREVARLRSALTRLSEPEEVLRAIRHGEIDALVVEEGGREEIYSLRRLDFMYRSVVEESLPYGVWLAEPDGTLLHVSRSFLDLVGSDLRGLRERGQFHFLPPESRDRAERQWKESRESSGPFNVEYTLRLDDGSERAIWTHAILARTQDGLPYWVGINLDVTERERIKDELRQQADALREADRRKDDFLATLAHELRNPLAPIRYSLQILRLGGDEQAVEQARSTMERQLRQMVRLIDDLLDVSRITSGKLRLSREVVDLGAAVQCAVEATRQQIESGGLGLVVTLPPQPVRLDADSTRLAQIFSNLLNNAAKFSEPGGQVRLAAERRGDEVVVVVRDEGIGIAAEHLPRLFQRFSQVDSALERSHGGLGIGLSLVKGLVEMHGGTVEARSEGVGRGSEFVVRLPALVERPKPRRDGEPDGAGGGESGPSGRRILVVDDMRDSAITLGRLLKLMGHEVRTAHDGLEALGVAEAFRPEVILMDIGMPRLNGYEAARHIREQAWGRGMVLVALTGWGQEEDKRRATEAGFDRHLTKPVDPDALSTLLAELEPSPP